MEDNKKVFTKEDFEFVQMNEKIFDKKFETKAIGYFGDALRRFVKNKSSVVAFAILLIIILMAIFMPMISPYKNTSTVDSMKEAYLPPRIPGLEKLGIFDGTKKYIANTKYIISLDDERVSEMDSNDLKDYFFIEYIVGYDTVDELLNSSAVYTEIFKGETYEKVEFKYNVYQALNRPQWTGVISYSAYLEYQESGVLLTHEDGTVASIIDTTPAVNELKRFIKKEKLVKGKDYDTISVDDEKLMQIYKEKNDKMIEELYNYNALIDPTKASNYKEVYHYFGTDNVGRDVWYRLWKGTRLSLLIGLFVAIVSISVGVVWGSISGYYGGTVDIVMERFTEILTGIPWIVIMTITKMLLIGHIPNLFIVSISLILTSWTGTASMVRSQMYRYKNREYVLASRTLGAGDFRLIFKHILPNALGTIVTSCVLVIPSAIFFESSVAYLGLGVDSQTISIGNLLNAGQTLGIVQYPYLTLFPALLISILMISFNMFGNGLRDALNPSLRGSE